MNSRKRKQINEALKNKYGAYARIYNVFSVVSNIDIIKSEKCYFIYFSGIYLFSVNSFSVLNFWYLPGSVVAFLSREKYRENSIPYVIKWIGISLGISIIPQIVYPFEEQEDILLKNDLTFLLSATQIITNY